MRGRAGNAVSDHDPAAGGLRSEALAELFEIAAELARMDDLRGEINKLSLRLSHNALPAVGQIHRMDGEVGTMWHLALAAFAERDAWLARSIRERDNEVDKDYARICESLPTLKNDAHELEQGPCLVQTAHHLERTADRMLNICEQVVYAVMGNPVEFDGARV